MRRNMSGNLGMYKYLWPGSVYSILSLVRTPRDHLNLLALSGIRINRSGVAKVSGGPGSKVCAGPLAPLVQIGVVNFKEVRGMHLDKFGFGNGISRI